MARKILIIEDNEQDRKILKKLLREAGYEELSFAEKGEEGVEKAKSENPDIVIVDTLLPGIDGFEACRRLKNIKNFGAKIIMITGHIDAIDAVKARKMGADDYCVKTVDYGPLIEIINNLASAPTDKGG